jgi:hypothetical protein
VFRSGDIGRIDQGPHPQPHRASRILPLIRRHLGSLSRQLVDIVNQLRKV